MHKLIQQIPLAGAIAAHLPTYEEVITYADAKDAKKTFKQLQEQDTAEN